jgi:uncharacterized protein (DUF1800 family)
MRVRLSVGTFLLAATCIQLHSAAQAQDNSALETLPAAIRFLEQASWGPAPSDIPHIRQVGFDRWLEEQLALPPSELVDPPAGTKGLAALQQQFFLNAVEGEDQLRQRIAFALSEIWVVSGVKINLPEAMAPYLRLLAKDAFGNYYDLMRDITMNPAMGHYLDMVNNDKPNPAAGRSANENYARELMQLFTLGEVLLNPDGTPKLDSKGNTIPVYTQDTIENLARTFTGWTYPPAPGAATRAHNPPYWNGEMVPVEGNHDQGAKTLLNGVTLRAGQSAKRDLESALENIFENPNLGPFVSKQLIQHLVTSNPSPAFVARVVRAFENNGSGVRGDLSAVVRTILLDPEVRAVDDGRVGAADTGHLKEPVLFIAGLLRALSAAIAPENTMPATASQLGQNLYYPASVFSYFSPGYRIPGTPLSGPEFQIFTTSTALLRSNFVYALLFGNPANGVQIDLTPWTALAKNPQDLLDMSDTLFLHGSMPTQMRTSILTALSSAGTDRLKAQTALYLVSTSSLYQVTH